MIILESANSSHNELENSNSRRLLFGCKLNDYLLHIIQWNRKRRIRHRPCARFEQKKNVFMKKKNRKNYWKRLVERPVRNI